MLRLTFWTHRTIDLPDSDLIKACYLNARSIRNKFLDLEELVAAEKFDIIAISESWVNTKDRDFLAEYNLPGYSIFSCDRENRAATHLDPAQRWCRVEQRRGP